MYSAKEKILIPAFALGRAQEVLLILRAAIQNQEIPAVPASSMPGSKSPERIEQNLAFSCIDQTGWCIRIADKVNQNELLKIAQLLCQKYEIPLRKTPSYLPENKTVQMKVGDTTNPENLLKAADEFLQKTGCACRFV